MGRTHRRYSVEFKLRLVERYLAGEGSAKGLAGLALLCAAGLAACGQRGCVRLTTSALLLEHPSPLGYPSSNPRPNRVLGELAPGTYTYRDRTAHHDFLVYRLAVGALDGYVIADTSMRTCQRAE